MKIDRLRTLNQFRTGLNNMTDQEFCNFADLHVSNQLFDLMKQQILAAKWLCFNTYANYILNNLGKEMFVNEIDKPIISHFANGASSMIYQQRLKAWQEAEKKVIFNGLDISDDGIIINKSTLLPFESLNNLKIIDLIEKLYIKNIKLKNVEL
jgi:hypothetical protein